MPTDHSVVSVSVYRVLDDVSTLIAVGNGEDLTEFIESCAEELINSPDPVSFRIVISSASDTVRYDMSYVDADGEPRFRVRTVGSSSWCDIPL